MLALPVQNVAFKFDFKGLESVSNQLLVSRLVNEMSLKIIENSIHAVVNMATRDTKDGLAELLSELLSANHKVCE
jgi:hypothetical protein